jgi:hypothetical protein
VAVMGWMRIAAGGGVCVGRREAAARGGGVERWAMEDQQLRSALVGSCLGAAREDQCQFYY